MAASDENSRAPRVPSECAIRNPIRTTTKTRPRAGQPAKERPCWDVRYMIDGRRYFRRFDKAGDADVYVAQLRRGETMGWPFDSVARRFVDPEAARWVSAPDDADDEASEATLGPTVVSWTDRYWARKWPSLEPKGRAQLARYLNRARRWLVDAEPDGADLADVEAFLATASLTVAPVAPTPQAGRGAAWLRVHSLPMASVGRHDLEALVERFSRHQRDPNKRVAAASIKRMVADLRPCWERAVVEEVIAVNPWRQVDLGLRSLTGGKRTGDAVLAADADLVLDPSQVWTLADACAEHGTWGPAVHCFVLVMGFCGLRPNEAAGLIAGDLDIDDDGPGWLTVRRNHRRVSSRYLDPEDDPTWGPLKGRELSDVRRVPVPSAVARFLREHLATHRAGAGAKALVFERHGHPFDLSNFNGDVWVPGRSALFPLDPELPADSPLQPKLARLRRHDLRHSACSTWLRAGIDVNVCQKWSGHKRLSVFLDVYQGVMPGREEDGVQSLERLLGAEALGSVGAPPSTTRRSS